MGGQLAQLAVVANLANVPALGAGGRRFKSSRPDHLKQGLMASAVSPFCLWVAFWVAFWVGLKNMWLDGRPTLNQ